MEIKTIKQITKEIKKEGLKEDYQIYFYLKNKMLIDINIIETIKQIQKGLK